MCIIIENFYLNFLIYKVGIIITALFCRVLMRLLGKLLYKSQVHNKSSLFALMVMSPLDLE